jgi:hypothetical protein
MVWIKMIIQGREVTLVDPARDEEWLREFETKAREVPNFFGNHSLLGAISQNGSVFFSVEDIGIIGVMNVRQGYLADAHMTFIKKPSAEIVDVCKEVADIIMACANLQMLVTAMPTNRVGLAKFAEAVGFVPVEKSRGILLLAKLRKEVSNGD